MLAIASGLHAVPAINRLVASWLERKLGDFATTTCAGQIHIKHLARGAWAAVKTAAETAACAWFAIAVSAIAFGAKNWSVA